MQGFASLEIADNLLNLTARTAHDRSAFADEPSNGHLQAIGRLDDAVIDPMHVPTMKNHIVSLFKPRVRSWNAPNCLPLVDKLYRPLPQ